MQDFHFEELEDKIRGGIERLNGAVLPKLNWSAPKDAQWISGTLKCESISEVLTLLKASDFISHDLCHAFDLCPSERKRPDHFTLILRRWQSLHESNEFRCFVCNSHLVGISQRQTSGFFEHLVKDSEAAAIKNAIESFFQNEIVSSFTLNRYVFDVYVDVAPRRRVWLVDFSPWGSVTEPALFDWTELNVFLDSPFHETTEFRVVRSETECRGKLSSYHCVPLELAQLNTGEGLTELLVKADQFLKEQGHSN